MSGHDPEWLHRVAALALGVHPAEGRAEIEAHVAACETCRRHLALYGAATAALEPGQAEPPSGAFHRIRAAIERDRLDGGQRDTLERMDAALGEGGLASACATLNARTGHRWTGVFRLDPPVMRPVSVHDRTRPDGAAALEPIRLASTYCSIILSSRAPFFTGDAAAEPRLGEHPARDWVRAYCGVYLEDDRSRPFGTLCHFDTEPRPVPHEEIPLMRAVAPLLMRRLGV